MSRTEVFSVPDAKPDSAYIFRIFTACGISGGVHTTKQHQSGKSLFTVALSVHSFDIHVALYIVS